MASTNVQKDAGLVLLEEIGQRLFERVEIIRLEPRIILNLGLGTSTLSKLLEKRYRKAIILNTDLTSEKLLVTKKTSRWRSRQRFILGSANPLPLRDHSIDLIISNLTLHHYQDLPAVFQELKRVLKPGGLLQFSTLGQDTLYELQASTNSKTALTGNLVDLHDLGDLLLKTHFIDPVIDMETIIFNYSKFADLISDLRMFANSGFGYAPSLEERDFINANYENFRDERGKLPATFKIVYGHTWGPPQLIDENKKTTPSEIHIPLHAIRRK